MLPGTLEHKRETTTATKFHQYNENTRKILKVLKIKGRRKEIQRVIGILLNADNQQMH